MKFMMLMIPKGYETAEPGTMPAAKAVAAMMKYNESLQKAGVLLGPGRAASAVGWALASRSQAAEPKVTDGPFAEAKEVIGGYWMIQVKSKEEAIEVGVPVPGFGQRGDRGSPGAGVLGVPGRRSGSGRGISGDASSPPEPPLKLKKTPHERDAACRAVMSKTTQNQDEERKHWFVMAEGRNPRSARTAGRYAGSLAPTSVMPESKSLMEATVTNGRAESTETESVAARIHREIRPSIPTIDPSRARCAPPKRATAARIGSAANSRQRRARLQRRFAPKPSGPGD